MMFLLNSDMIYKRGFMPKSFKIFYKHIALFLLLLIIGTYVIGFVETGKRDQYLQMQAELLQTKYDTNYRYFKIMSEDIYAMLMDNPAIIKIFGQAKNSDVPKQAELRKQLYDLLKKRYKRLKNMGVEQLHFHLPDNTSFLRMHKPEKFGDDLSEVRYSVALTNKTKVYTEGFELGRAVHGFRFVYPVYDDQKEYLGSLEVSYASKQMLNVIMDTFIHDAHFLISKKIVEEKTWQDERKKYYRSGWESPDYLLETVTHSMVGEVNLYKEIRNGKLGEKIAKGIKSKKPFALVTIYNFQSIVLSFLPIRNIQDSETVAYLVTYTESDYLDNLEMEEHYFMLLFYAIVFMLFIFGFYAIINKEKLHEMAHFDVLTKLPNRAAFYIEFQLELYRAQRSGKKLALLFIDLDGFKAVNDTYGHGAGDRLLVDVSQRLRASVRKSDIIARLGGDEFTVLLSDLHDAKESLVVAQKIIEVLNKEFKFKKKSMKIGASIGIAVCPEHGEEIDTLVKKADNMMYQVKRAGKNNVKMYES